MKDSTIKIRVDDDFIEKVKYITAVNDYKSISETIREVIAKEYRRETMKQ